MRRVMQSLIKFQRFLLMLFHWFQCRMELVNLYNIMKALILGTIYHYGSGVME